MVGRELFIHIRYVSLGFHRLAGEDKGKTAEVPAASSASAWVLHGAYGEVVMICGSRDTMRIVDFRFAEMGVQ